MENIKKTIKNSISSLKNSNQTFKELFDIIHKHNNRICYETTDGYRINKITYSECQEEVIRVATIIQEKFKEINHGSYIGIFLESSLDYIIIMWALLMAGYKPVLLNVRLPDSLNQEIVSILDIKLIISDGTTNLNTNIIFYEEEIKNDIIKNEAIREFSWEDELVLSTSASSLNIKICVYDGKTFCEQIKHTEAVIKDNYQIARHHNGSLKLLVFLPYYHIFGLTANYFWFAIFGRTFVGLKNYSSDTILKTIQKHQVTHIFGVPMLWNTVVKEIKAQIEKEKPQLQKRFKKAIDLSLAIQNIFPRFGRWFVGKFFFKQIQQRVFGNSVKFMISGGSSLPSETLIILNGIGYPLYNGYGMTETGITSVELRPKPKYRILGTVGKPFPAIKYHLENNQLFISGAAICSKIITINGARYQSNNHYFKTGDLCHIDRDGYYYIDGRIDDLVIAENGENYNPEQIEKLFNFKIVNRFILLGIKKDNYKNDMSLIIEINQSENPLYQSKIIKEIDDNINILLNNNINNFNVYITFNQLMNDNAIKISRNQVIKLIASNQLALIGYSEYKQGQIQGNGHSSDKILELIKKCMAEVVQVNCEDINDETHFIYDLGGSSIEYFTLLIQLKKEFNIEFATTSGELFYTPKSFGDYIIKNSEEFLCSMQNL